MADLQRVRKNLATLRKRDAIWKIVLRILKRYEAYLIDLNQIQLSNNKNILDQSIGEYKLSTQLIASSQFTRQPKIAGQGYNFEWSGDLFDGMRIRVTNSYVEIYSTASHANEVEDKFSGVSGNSLLFGLTEPSKAELIAKIILPELRKEVCAILEI